MGSHYPEIPETEYSRRVKIHSRTQPIKAGYAGKLRRDFQPENRAAPVCKENLPI
jgi:hypothetical protein